MSVNLTMNNTMSIRSLKAPMGLNSLRSFSISLALSLALILVSVSILVSVIILRIPT